MTRPVLTLRELERAELAELVARYGMALVAVPDGEPIPGSYWGEPEAGLVESRLYARGDTPVHSVLHELCHYVCMTAERRAALDRDAGGDDAEECAVCYLQVLVADGIAQLGRERLLDDMDAWGYSFREGSARAWLHGDGLAARQWLAAHGLIDALGRPNWRIRRPLPEPAVP